MDRSESVELWIGKQSATAQIQSCCLRDVMLSECIIFVTGDVIFVTGNVVYVVLVIGDVIFITVDEIESPIARVNLLYVNPTTGC